MLHTLSKYLNNLKKMTITRTILMFLCRPVLVWRIRRDSKGAKQVMTTVCTVDVQRAEGESEES